MDAFYLRYYVGHEGKFGHEFLEFEVREDGRVRYANCSNYKSDLMIRKEVFVSPTVVQELRRIVGESNVLNLSDANWPEPDRDGRQELEIADGDGKRVLLTSAKIGSMSDVAASQDPAGMGSFYYAVQDLKCFLFSLIKVHFRVKPV